MRRSRIKILLLGLLCVLSVSSCISNKKIVYLQSNVNGKPSVDSTDLILNRFSYRLQVNDILYISIRSNDEKATSIFNTMSQDMRFGGANAEVLFYINSYVVDAKGEIEIPIIGKINVLGLTILEAKEKTQLSVNEYFKSALVIFRYAGLKFSVLGEVKVPGRFVLFQNQVTIFEALSSCGDINLIGNRKNVAIIRQYPEGVKVHTIDLTKVDLIKSPMYFLQPNDIIYVPPMKVREFGAGLSAINTLQAFASVLTVVLLFVNITKK